MNVDKMRIQIELPGGRGLDAWIDSEESGVPLVFFEGTPASGMPFAPHVAAARERGLRWVSWGLPGYGRSTRREGRSVADVAADTTQVLDRLGAQEAYVAGWSGGGPHALAVGALLPERVLGISVIGGEAPYPAPGIDYLAGMGEENVEEFKASLEGPDALAEVLEQWWPEFRNATGTDIADAFHDVIDEVDRAALTGDFAEWIATDMREALRDSYFGWLDDDLAFVSPWGFTLDSFEVPVHIWQGGHDLMVPFAHGEWLAAHVRNACPHLLPEQGHLSLGIDCFDTILDEMVSR
jgi:pimeloyl-ACP methyl ester carboxylesterase